MTINQVVEKVISSVDPNWSTLEKIRYVYIKVGEFVSKDTDFFFSVDNKLGEQQLSLDTIKEIYDDEKVSGNLKVICRSASYILQRIYDELGIESDLIQTNSTIIATENEEQFLIYHWILVAKDGDKNYFMTLSADLPYIQMGMETRHFASNIPYKRKIGNKEVQVYMGDEIVPSTIDKTELREVDKKIGYLKLQYNYDENYKKSNDYHFNYEDASLYMLANELNSNKLYMDEEIANTQFYHNLTEFHNGNKFISFAETPKDEITASDWNVWIRKLCKYVHRRIEKIVEYKIHIQTYYDEVEWNYEEWIEDISRQVQRHVFKQCDKSLDHLWIGDEFDYGKWSRKLKKDSDFIYDGLEVDNVISMLDKTNTLARMIKSNHQPKNFMTIFNSLTYHFVNKNYLFEGSLDDDGKVSSKYLARKFKTVFTRVFSCNEEIIDLNRMEYSEQIVIIKMIMDRMFPELNSNNAIIDDNYNEAYSVVQNRIPVYSLKHKETGDYVIVFHVVGDDNYSGSYYFYDLKTNQFSIANILKLNKEYTIVSDRFKSRIEEIESKIEKRNKR